MQAGKLHQVYGRLCLSRTLQHPAIRGPQREDMPWTGEVLRRCRRVNKCPHRSGPVVRGDSRRHAMPGLDRYGERGAEPGSVVLWWDHQRKLESVQALAREWHADQPPRLTGHEVDGLGCRELGRDDEVALVLPVLVVYYDDELARAEVLQYLLNCC